jgi:hypothetical protein
MEKNTMGLRQRILNASTVSQIEALLEEGRTYEFAAEKTIRAWKNAAKRRVSEIKAQ